MFAMRKQGTGVFKGLKYFAAFLLAAGILLFPRPFLTMASYPDGHVYMRLAVKPQESFSVQWTHSVEKTPWREVYQIAPFGQSRMKLVETRFKSYGAGVPADAGGQCRVVDGWIVADLDQTRDEVIYLISRKDYVLELGNRTYPLLNTMPPDTSLRLFVKYLPWWFSLLELGGS